jgi:hypothetical protein
MIHHTRIPEAHHTRVAEAHHTRVAEAHHTRVAEAHHITLQAWVADGHGRSRLEHQHLEAVTMKR